MDTTRRLGRMLVAALLVTGCSSGNLGAPPTQSSTAALELCHFDAPADPAAVVLATPRGSDLVLIRAGGTSFVARTFAAPVVVVARGPYLAASAPAPGSTAAHPIHDVVLLDRDGRLLWSGQSGQAVDHLGGVNSVLNEHGQLALSLPGDGEGHDLLRVEPTGATQVVPGFLPLDRPLADGTIYVRANRQAGEVFPSAFGWWSPVRGFVPLAFPPAPDLATSYPERVEDRLIYTGLSNGQIVLVSQGLDDVKAFVLSNPYFGYIGWHGDSSWQLMHSWAGEPTSWLLDIHSGLAELDGGVFPPWPSTDEAGGLLRLRFEPSRATWERSSDGGQRFSPLGRTASGFQHSTITDRGGTFVIVTSSGVGPKESAIEWAPGPAAELSGDSWQVVRPSAGTEVAHDTPLASIKLSADGRCAAYWHTTKELLVLEALDVESGQTFPLLIEPAVGRAPHRTPAWLPDAPP